MKNTQKGSYLAFFGVFWCPYFQRPPYKRGNPGYFHTATFFAFVCPNLQLQPCKYNAQSKKGAAKQKFNTFSLLFLFFLAVRSILIELGQIETKVCQSDIPPHKRAPHKRAHAQTRAPRIEPNAHRTNRHKQTRTAETNTNVRACVRCEPYNYGHNPGILRVFRVFSPDLTSNRTK